MVENEYIDEGVVVTIDQSVIEAQSRAEIDMQISTAKRYPRDIKKAQQNSIVIATMDEEAAKSCKYSLPRAGKTITGPTVHLAKIIISQYGNMRVAARVVNNDGKWITSEGVCHDLETNLAVKVEVKRKITDKGGKTFSEDMQTVTGNAANSIALRNAVFAVIPKSIIDAVLKEAEKKIIGELSDQAKFLQKRTALMDGFKENYGLSQERVLAVVGIKEIVAMKPEHLVTLIGIAQAIKDGDSTVEESFPLTETEKQAKYDEKIKSKAKEKEEAKSTPGEQTTIQP